MVNYGRSAGCTTCKSRKVKCDESRPACRRCQSIGKSCPGYPDEWDLAFRSENEVMQFEISNGEGHSQDPIQIVSLDLPPLGLGNHLTTKLDLQVVPLFFQDFVVTTRNDSPYGWLEFLPGLFEKVSDDSALYQAVYAAAYANIAQKYDKLELQYEAIGYYSKALRLVNGSLAQPTLASRDITMTAVVLLGVYECIIGSLSTFAKDLSLCHIHGLGALASLRGVLFTTELDLSLLEIACCQMQRRNLDLGLTPGGEDERLMQLLGTSSTASRMVAGMYEVSKLLASTKSDSAHDSLNPKSNSAFLRDAWNIDGSLRCWEDDAIWTLPYEVSSPPSKHRDLFFCQKVEYHAYSNIWAAGQWNKHRAARIILHQRILEILDKSNPTGLDDQPRLSEQAALSLSIIYKMVHDVFASVAYSIGATAGSKSNFPRGVGGYFLIWSLKVILRCPFISGEQYFAARDVLWRLGKECGIGHAVIFSQNLKAASGNSIAYTDVNTRRCYES